MLKRVFSAVTFVLLLTSMLTLAFNIRPVKASGTIYIRVDGSIDPPDAAISTVDNVTYELTDNIVGMGLEASAIVIERDNIVLDGAGYTVEGTDDWGSIGINLTGRSRVTIKSMNIEKFNNGIYVKSSNDSIFSGNNLTNNWVGIDLYLSSSNSAFENNVTNNGVGIGLSLSSSNSIVENVFVNDGLEVIDSYGNVLSGNLVNGKPLVYLEGVTDRVVVDAGQVVLLNCSGMTVENLNLSGMDRGIQLWKTNNTRISGTSITADHSAACISLRECSNCTLSVNNLTNSGDSCVEVYDSYGITIERNTIGNASSTGILLDTSSSNNVINNILARNRYGVMVENGQHNVIFGNTMTECTISGAIYLRGGSSDNEVCGNTLENNRVGILLDESNNVVFHNNFLNNQEQVETSWPVNIWDDGYLHGGNYWSDYNGTDFYSGPHQDQIGSDGIGDTSYVIDENNQDHYPLMRPWTLLEHELVVSVTAPVGLKTGSSSLLNATLRNQGSSGETNVELSLLINGTTVNSATIYFLQAGNAYTLSSLWTPTVDGTCNVTAYVLPVTGETSIKNNQMSAFIIARTEPETITVPDDYPTIQEAINAAISGDTVDVRAGTYYENVVINKTVTLLGQHPNATIIAREKYSDAIRVTANGVTIQNLTITASGPWSYGISLASSNNVIRGNNITNIDYGIWLGNSNNNIQGNNIANNTMGILLYGASNNSISGNNITANKYIGIYLEDSANNHIFHNNGLTINDTAQVKVDRLVNVWDNGYPSGGNYWSDYKGTDIYSGAYQNQTGSDGIGDMPYIINENNRDNYPLMNPWPSGLGLHELETALRTPTHLQLGNSTLIEAVVTNNGITEQNVAFSLFINSTIVNSTTISTLEPASSNTIAYSWTPTAEGTYNITAYASPVSGETSLENNLLVKFVTVTALLPLSGMKVGVKSGDWIKVDYTITGAPSGTPVPQWLRVEFLTVEGTNATVRVTMHMSDGTEQNATAPVDIVGGGGEAFGLSGFVIPANLTAGDIVYMSGYGNVTIADETTRSYAGASRTVLSASLSQYGTQLTYYWDKQTGILVEASTTSGSITGTGKATETNIWQAAATGLPIEPIYLYVLGALATIMVVAAVFVMRRKKKPPEEVENLQCELRLTRNS